ncbi:GCN5 family acetyltransferase [Endozoicomonas montiporae]|uniref:GCN5 family acetyltransferase n=2 Tax=Endozoicomonas montiporae TaxID=1027273 RepID=A0A081N816_9GAMM|nr:GNAT family N-acetyltransferase [Endozoicomonas montiporae]AMO55527.1 N-acetyltransferase GCN5 [Endozoicomonas montiporae CL-33]KEQ14589.1 GCN5 family acetyltransferase [Endozoicomonas montiporae]
MNDSYELLIRKVNATELPMALLLEADPSEDNVRAYLSNSHCYCAELGKQVVGVCVLAERSEGCLELMNIAIGPDVQGQGFGTQLLNFVMSEARSRGVHRIELGTGTFGHQLGFYQRAEFRVEGVERDFFLDNYPEPIFENGIQHKDMLRLAVTFN